MSRTLRSNTRRDYKQMASGGDDAEEIMDENTSPMLGKVVSNKTIDSDDNISTISELVSDHDNISTPSDEDIEELERRIQERLAMKKKLENKERKKRLEKQLKEIGKQMEEREKKNRKKKGKINDGCAGEC